MSDEGLQRERAVEDRRKASKVCNIGNLEIVKGIFGDRMGEVNQEQNKNDNLLELGFEDFPENQKKMGINFMENAHNSMIGNFRSTKWLFYNLEEIREKVVKMERVKDVPELENQMDQGERLKTAERRLNELENFN